MRSTLVFSTLALVISFPAFAQSYLDQQLEISRENVRTYTRQINEMASQEESFNGCRARLVKFKRKSFQWALDHESELRTIDEALNSIHAELVHKLQTLKKSPVEVNPVKGQHTSRVQINLDKMVQFYRIYNARLKRSTVNDEEDLVLASEDPELNRAHVTYSQVNAATERMVTILNASLRQSSAEYSIEFQRTGNHYQLNLVVATVLGKDKRKLSLPLLNGVEEAITNPSLWHAVLLSPGKGPALANGESLNAYDRISESYSREFTNDCSLLHSRDFDLTDLNLSRALIPDFTKIETQAKTLINLEHNGPEILYQKESPNLQVTYYQKDSELNCENGYLLYVNNARWDSKKCLYNRGTSAEYHSQTYLFVLGFQGMTYYTGPNQGVLIPNTEDAFTPIAAGTFEDRPVITYLTKNNGIKTVDIGGNRVYARITVLPRSISIRKDQLELIPKDSERYCENGNLVYFQKLNWLGTSCYLSGVWAELWGSPWLFVVGSNHVIYYALDPVNSATVPHTENAQQIVSLDWVNRAIVITFLDQQGKLHKVDTSGKILN